MKVLVTGGAGYIGSTTAAALEESGHIPLILDSLLRGRREFLRHRPFYHADIADRAALKQLFADHPDIECTIHMAARTIVSESVAQPYAYYRDNVARSLEFIDSLVKLGKPKVVFSSSASVYARTSNFEVDENSPLDPFSPYGRTKRLMEMVLEDMARATDLRAIILRYFNPIGADPLCRSGDPHPLSAHVLGQLVAAARGDIDAFTVTGTNYPTRDGTGIRDYIHVWDLARAHVAAVERFDSLLGREGAPSSIINVGTGSGVTVLELIGAFERVIARKIPTRTAAPRPGDAVGSYANVEKAARLLGWQAEHTLDEAISSAIEWERRRHAVLGQG